MENIYIPQWRPVRGYEGLYEVSIRGLVKSLGNDRARKEKIMKAGLSGRKGNQYLVVGLRKNGVTKTVGVHVLVAQAYPEICGEWFEGAVCDHLDRDKTHNNALNIRVGTQKDNMNNPLTKKAMCEGQQKRTNYEGLKEKCSKTVYQYSKDTHELVKEWTSVNEVERQKGWYHQNISACCRNRFNREGNNVYKGFIWSYAPLT